MVGSLGSFVGPTVTGRLRDVTHSFSAGLFAVSGVALLAAVLCIFLPGRGQDKATEA